MKNGIVAIIAAAWLNTGAAFAEDTHEHEAVIPGPNGGKVFEVGSQHAEFLVNTDRTVTVTFYDGEMKSAPLDKQIVTVIAEAPAGKTKLELAARDGALSSSEPLPEGEGYRVVVQVRSAPDAKPQNFRVDLILSTCGECNRAEYACSCEHAGE